MKNEVWKDFFSEDYLGFSEVILHQERTNFEVKQLKSLIPKEGASILDLGCGQGRISIPLANEGYKIVGLDASPALLDAAVKRAKEGKSKVKFINEDMRNLSFENEFDVIINMGTAFGYIESSDEEKEILSKVFSALKPNGVFIQETENRELKLKNSLGKVWHEMGGVPVFSDRRFDVNTGRWEEKISWFADGVFKEKILNVRLYAATELISLHKEAGFRNTSLFGGFDFSPLDMNSERLLLVSKKPGESM